MSYSPPNMTIRQSFVSQKLSATSPLNACVVAPHYKLVGPDIDDAESLLGSYVGAEFTRASWPGHATSRVIDFATARMFAKDGVFKYAEVSLSGSATDGLTSSGGNRVRLNSHALKTANGTSISSAFAHEFPEVGDYVKLAKGGSSVESRIMAIVADAVAASVGVTAARAGNAGSASAAAVVTKGDGIDAGVEVEASATAYNGLVSGRMTETYTCVVTATDGTLANTYLSVTSASGTDNVSSLQLGSGAKALGTRGATITVTYGESAAFDVGQSFTVAVTAAHTPVSPTAGGAFTGSLAGKYLISVTSGGIVGTDTIVLTVKSDNGMEDSQTVNIAAAGTVSVGSYGLTLAFTSANHYVTGDGYSVEVTPVTSGAFKTIVLSDKLTGWTTSDVITVTFAKIADEELPSAVWEADSDGFTVAAELLVERSGRDVYSSELLKGALHIKYRELDKTYSGVAVYAADTDDALDMVGTVNIENPVSVMLDAALAESGGVPVYFITLDSDDLAGYQLAAARLESAPAPYGVVPFSSAAEIADVFFAHAVTMSSESKALFRKLYCGIDEARQASLYSEDASGDMLKGTLASGTLTCAEALFFDASIRAGDLLRIDFGTDQYGHVTYSEYEVLAVLSQDTLSIDSGSAVVPDAMKFEIWRVRTNQELATAVAARAAHFSSIRVGAVYSDGPLHNGVSVSNSVVAARVAGQRAAAAPHASLSRATFTGLDIDNSKNFTEAEMNIMGSSGVWVVAKSVDGEVFNRHQLTTDMSDSYHQEDSKISNFDHVLRDMRDSLAPLYGKGNATTDMLEIIRGKVIGQAASITSRSYDKELGPQITDIDITKLYIDPVEKNQIILTVDISTPDPLNSLDATFVLV